MARFVAKIYKLGINPVVDPPERVLAEVFRSAGRSSGPIQVCGSLNDVPFIQTLVKYRGAWRLYINGAMLKASGLAVGNKTTIEIEFDVRPRSVPMPALLRRALAKDAEASAAFDKLTPSRKKEIFRYLSSLKTDASIERNIERLLAQLRGE